MKNTHPPEPWRVGQSSGSFVDIRAGSDEIGESILVATAESADTARRIVACCNAFAGVPTELIQKFATEFMYARRGGKA